MAVGDLLLFKFTSRKLLVPIGTYCAATIARAPDPDDDDHRLYYRALNQLTRRLLADPMPPAETQVLFGRSYGIGIMRILPGRMTDLLSRLDARRDLPGVPRSAVETRRMTKAERLARDATFCREVIRNSRGWCIACGRGISYAGTGVLQAAHIRAVSDSGNDHLSNGLSLCPTHHALFDRYLWTISGDRFEFASALPTALRRSFTRTCEPSWALDPRQVAWHRRHFRSAQRANSARKRLARAA
jgi:hypothetical protein